MVSTFEICCFSSQHQPDALPTLINLLHSSSQSIIAMWLLHSRTMELKQFISDNDIPPYAILSHTWGDEEVTFDDWQNLARSPKDVVRKRGYEKIDLTCQQAAEERIDWVWVDTCCIDKKSSAELSEAINSMFRWYKEAVVCYAYLVDVPFTDSKVKNEKSISGSRWFTRGWTLQELLAPAHVVFFSRNWRRLGTKSGLCDLLRSITRIEQRFLRGDAPLEDASIAKRMSWAAGRSTSRSEDMAYCLLGLFDINMPLLYGEGSKAFLRLQGELVKSYPYDHSIFAWGKIVEEPSFMLKDRTKLDNPDAIKWDAREASKTLGGLLAKSPRDFASSSDFAPCGNYKHFWNPDMKFLLPTITPGGGIEIELGTKSTTNLAVYHLRDAKVATLRPILLANLICQYRDSCGPAVALPLMRSGGKTVGRTNEIVVFSQPLTIPGALKFSHVFQVDSVMPPKLESGDMFVRLCATSRASFSTTYMPPSVFSVGNGLLKVQKNHVGLAFAYKFHLLSDRSLGFFLAFERVVPALGHTAESETHLTVTLLPTSLSDFSKQHPIVTKRTPRLDWYTSQQRWSQLITSDFERTNSRTLEAPKDSWEIDVYPFPKIKVTARKTKVERPGGSEKSSYFDLIDLSMIDDSPTEQKESR
ncbi:heterokaryon incompatibility protein-domain-containing protein [Podospora aff. communis PSN243]|uniref:Heterokaryon incompatibility protein-domain-containing protein n=1 Tax=Podospora aff. communis PSN243 TaxID=3040156 RepID=A0AAV9GRU9_9PEZI|nr:heterokaryon incompatibility protein-domain-containing protein [Podospora aff. communis PSN243]